MLIITLILKVHEMDTTIVLETQIRDSITRINKLNVDKKVEISTIETAKILLMLWSKNNIQCPAIATTEEGEIIFSWDIEAAVLTIRRWSIELSIVKKDFVDMFDYNIEDIDKIVEQLKSCSSK